ncbi:MAG: DHH family phosphoesterase [Acutalibacteraceae bacterium]
MKVKAFLNNYPLQVLSFILAVVFTAIMSHYNWQVAVAQVCFIALISIAGMVRTRLINEKLKRAVKKTANYLDFSQKNSLDGFPFPVIVAEDNGKILWCNDLFYKSVIEDKQLQSDSVEQFIGANLAQLSSTDNYLIEYNEKKYTLYSNKITVKNSTTHMIYFVDDTLLKNIASEHELSRPAVLHIVVDNLEELSQKYKDSEIAVINGGIEKIIESWIAKFPCVMRKISNGKFFIVVEERGLVKMIEERFKVLDEIRAYEYDEKIIGISLSIGASRGSTMLECDNFARQALDMAQSRGGDQVALKTDGNYEFFGGVSSGMEKRTKTKTRIISAALEELLENSENVLVMGHCNSDLDSVGAAVGICSAAQAVGKSAKIVLYREKTLAEPLIKHLEDNGKGELFIEPEQAKSLINKKTLLVIVDTHRAQFLEHKPIYDAVQNVVVIDHHRKTVDYIDKAVIFYNEPIASSAAEMVTEILQYITVKSPIDSVTAEALLAGIMLDTRNFVLRTGVRSFEAAAYLRGRGANTVAVKRLFANSMENYKQRNNIIGNSTTYKNCALAIAPDNIENIRVVASQVADELLNIKGIKSSYVIFRTENSIDISARSMGEMNVQVIMEKLGGGGHQTMAATQLKDITMEEALSKLRDVLDDFFDEND